MMAYKNVVQELQVEKEVIQLRAEPKIGISKLVVEAPQTYFSYVELANALNRKLKEGKKPIEPNKIKDGLGIEKARMPTYSQSNVTLAANALYSFIKNVDSSDSGRKKFFGNLPGSIYYATESNPDFSRPEAEIALGLVYSRLLDENETRYRPYVEALKNAGVQQNTFACAGAGLALSSAVSEIYTANSMGKRSSAIVLSADTAVYDSVRAPDAETTQGSSATLMWITTEPSLISINYNIGYGRFNMPFPDFTKFGVDTPFVHGKFSEKGYVYAVAMALGNLEKLFDSTRILYSDENAENANAHKAYLADSFDMKEFSKKLYNDNMSFFASHVPFPKQAIYFASFLYEHYLKNYEHEKFLKLQDRESLGKSPLGEQSLVELFTTKLRNFGENLDADIVDYIDSDPDISAYWAWLGKLRKQPEFEEFLANMRIKEALELPSQVGNSYTGSTIIALASLLKSGKVFPGEYGITAFFGSGMVAVAYQIEMIASQGSIGRDLVISMDNKKDMPLSFRDYEQLHSTLIKGDAKRSMINQQYSLIEKDIELLRGKLPEGFLIRRRNVNGTWEAEFVENGNRHVLKPRF
ncbi:MAG: hypothetical protein M1465_03140 [Candidatus Marsarchaeota archaeon]|jgi:3-hydroxy-3-methylglutaryl CoA synthase|nr:hypothetical protein [Candidatus Marsarchaeota archaeon]